MFQKKLHANVDESYPYLYVRIQQLYYSILKKWQTPRLTKQLVML